MTEKEKFPTGTIAPLRAGRPKHGERAFLAAHGITKKLSMQAQALARLPKSVQDDVAHKRMSLAEAVRIFHLAKRIALRGEDL